MGKISYEKSQDLKAIIYDLDERAIRQVLFGIVEILKVKSSVLTDQFKALIDDGARLTEFDKASIKGGII